jgi:hypothetical protein
VDKDIHHYYDDSYDSKPHFRRRSCPKTWIYATPFQSGAAGRNLAEPGSHVDPKEYYDVVQHLFGVEAARG